MGKIYFYQRMINMKNSDMEFTTNAKVELTLLLSSPSYLIRKLKNLASHGTSQGFKVYERQNIWENTHTHTHTPLYVCGHVYMPLSFTLCLYNHIHPLAEESEFPCGAFPGGLVIKNPPGNAEDVDLILVWQLRSICHRAAKPGLQLQSLRAPGSVHPSWRAQALQFLKPAHHN